MSSAQRSRVSGLDALGAPPGKRSSRRVLFALATACALAAALALGRGAFAPPSTENAFEGRPEPTEQLFTSAAGRSIFAAATGLDSGPLIVFVHGTPGAWNDFAFVMATPELAARARLVAVDRIGWGHSAEGGIEASLAEQARAVASVIEAQPETRTVVLVGHSLGAPIAARLAADRADLIDALVLVAGALDPALEEPTWYQALGRTAWITPLVPEVRRRADLELLSLRAELEALAPALGELTLPVRVLHGLDDALVPVENADYLARSLRRAPFEIERIPDQGHLIPWQCPERIVAVLLALLSESDSR